MAAPVPLDELLKDSDKLNEALERAVVDRDVDRVALLIKHAQVGCHFRSLIYVAHLQVVFFRAVGRKRETGARIDRVMEIVLERFEEIKKDFDKGSIAAIRELCEDYPKAVTKEKRDVGGKILDEKIAPAAKKKKVAPIA